MSPVRSTDTFLTVPGSEHHDVASIDIRRATSNETSVWPDLIEAVDHRTRLHRVGHGRIIEGLVGTRSPGCTTFVTLRASKGLVAHARAMGCGATPMAPDVGPIRRDDPGGGTVLSASVTLK